MVQISSLEFRPRRNWLVISQGTLVIPRILILKVQSDCQNDFARALETWTVVHGLSLHRL